MTTGRPFERKGQVCCPHPAHPCRLSAQVRQRKGRALALVWHWPNRITYQGFKVTHFGSGVLGCELQIGQAETDATSTSATLGNIIQIHVWPKFSTINYLPRQVTNGGKVKHCVVMQSTSQEYEFLCVTPNS